MDQVVVYYRLTCACEALWAFLSYTPALTSATTESGRMGPVAPPAMPRNTETR